MTDRINVTTSEAATVLEHLQKASEPITAETFGRLLHLKGKVETQRRRVRAIVQVLRERDGQWIVAFNPAGYWLTNDEKLWRDYLDGRKIDARRILGKAHRREKMLTNSQGQGLFF